MHNTLTSQTSLLHHFGSLTFSSVLLSLIYSYKNKTKKRTPCCVVSTTDSYDRILGFLDQSRHFFFQAAPQLYSRGWVDPVPDLLLRKSGSAWNRTRTSRSVARKFYHETTEVVIILVQLEEWSVCQEGMSIANFQEHATKKIGRTAKNIQDSLDGNSFS
jgi:hypothetical protein